MALVGLLLALAGCGAQTPPTAPRGPGASASPAPAQAVINRGCAGTPQPDAGAIDTRFLQSSMLRQEADLQRVADDLSGAVPGGDLPTDTRLAQENARQLVDLVNRSTLCSPFREKLGTAAAALSGADDALVQAGDGGVDPALRAAMAKFQALKSLSEDPGRG
jgi:hypothetical protein